MLQILIGRLLFRLKKIDIHSRIVHFYILKSPIDDLWACNHS